MSAVEHLKTLCCLGLPPESAMIAVTPLLHEIIPHGWSRLGLVTPDAAITGGYAENPEAAALYRERLWRVMNEPVTRTLWKASIRAVGIGYSLHRQGPGWLERAWYREIEAPLDACWVLDAMIGDGGRSIGFVYLTRPRSARPFTVDDVQRLDWLRPWLAHAFRGLPAVDACPEDQAPIRIAGEPVVSGQIILTPDTKLIHQTPGIELLLRILAGQPDDYTRYVPARDKLPAPVLKLLRQITGAASGTSNAPPRVQVSNAYGVLTLEAKWLVPAGTLHADAARDPKSCLIAVTIELREHAIAHAARVLREGGATPAQTKVGIHLALGKSRPEIAGELGIQLCSVADHTKNLYQTLDVHNSTELATKIWLGQRSRRGAPRIAARRMSFFGAVLKSPSIADENAAAAMERAGRRGRVRNAQWQWRSLTRGAAETLVNFELNRNSSRSGKAFSRKADGALSPPACPGDK
jgi:DNA-binding CsgD family transcriptional regulator